MSGTLPPARESHYTPRSYLGRFSPDTTGRVWAYPLLVPHVAVPPWRLRSPKGIAVQRDLYTSVAEGQDSDKVEQWFNHEVENPATPVLDRLERGVTLSARERRILARYVAALDVRTPAGYSEFTTRVSSALSPVLENIANGAAESLRMAAKGEYKLESQEDLPLHSHSVDVRIHTDATEDDPNRGLIEIRAVVGRELWLNSVEHCVNDISQLLEHHAWDVLEPHPGWRWYTSDQPVMRLQYFGHDHYDFRGGWGQPGTELLLPLSPARLLYAQVGRPPRTSRVCTIEQTLLFQKLIAENAFRWIVGSTPPIRATWFRPRTVDLAAYNAEQEAWSRFHTEQTRAHMELMLREGA
ncbi:MAG: hypothetical protein JWL61_2208 [Gemmatimonadetes bacterium]|nr:hypothetical protein [Gemmatimonadota bacterium]